MLIRAIKVVGIDISPHMVPPERPPNLDLQVDDLNQRLTFSANYFDLVHSQLMLGGIHRNRWRGYLRDIHRVLRPGGWCQMAEIYFNAQSDNGTLTHNHALRRWSQAFLQSLEPSKDPRVPLQLEALMRHAGFVDVESRLLPLPLCGWSTDPRERDIGMANQANVHRMLSALAVYPFTQFLRMSMTDVQLLVAQARAEADNPAFKAYFPVYVVFCLSAIEATTFL
ncbi:S-adenosyl-L-methionine-dependent methyltransferase [Pleurostoma richardsiae]|uniref:S-adenosyl-L-methionine-dependent methyltransferase n=1 Tax=Pleurostoma richardsiae TaxID=41990 RepID=A0AA38RA04_9PEZI|nr:S-adenosyl-L-methionine-dependent methyltransferase [Pleurostoma richardsiae]